MTLSELAFHSEHELQVTGHRVRGSYTCGGTRVLTRSVWSLKFVLSSARKLYNHLLAKPIFIFLAKPKYYRVKTVTVDFAAYIHFFRLRAQIPGRWEILALTRQPDGPAGMARYLKLHCHWFRSTDLALVRVDTSCKHSHAAATRLLASRYG